MRVAVDARGTPAMAAAAPPAVRPGGGRDTGVLVVSHSHPAITKGGAEIAAFEMFRALRASEGFEAAFLGCSRTHSYRRLGQAITQPFTDEEYVYSAGDFDWFKFGNPDPKFPREFKALLRELRPDVVHFHHYINLGLEAFLHVKDVLPDARVVLTLHEYLLICNHLGQMIKSEKGLLCNRSGLVDCASCFPSLQPADFMLRRMFIDRFLAAVDHFVSPSAFLADRYVAWGVPPSRISVIENVVRPGEARDAVASSGASPGAGPRPPAARGRRRRARGPLRIGFFGQISRLKGINVILDAARILERAEDDDLVFEIHGEYRGQPAEFQAEFLARLEKIGPNVRYHGPYQNELVDGLMQGVDAVLVPSIWWENSPVVIQEALRNRRPILCSDIGGMAEKVRHGLDGLHFPVGSALGLIDALRKLVDDPLRFASTQAMPQTAEDAVAAHVSLYRSLHPAALAEATP